MTVTYELPEGNVKLEGECLAWFNSLDEITEAFLADPVGRYAFGEPVSISESLRGQNVALLFICNHVTYHQPLTGDGDMLIRYYATNPEWVAWRGELTSVMDSMVVITEEEFAAKKAEAEAAAQADAEAQTEAEEGEEDAAPETETEETDTAE